MIDERVLRLMVETCEQGYHPDRPQDPVGGPDVLLVDEYPDEQQRDGHSGQQPPHIFELGDLVQGCLTTA
ncbi:hypothetical protein D3C80_167790 [compost metagenome]